MARPTTDLAEWLGRHGLGQYAQTFARGVLRYHRGLHDAADYGAIGEHVEIVVVPLAGRAGSGGDKPKMP
jgi:hypothetical protein